MQIGMIGLGRMGMNMARRLLRDGHELVVYNRSQDKVEAIAREGAEPTASIEEFSMKLTLPRIAWFMLPAGEITERYIAKLSPYLTEGDILIDGSNGYYRDDVRRKEQLGELGISYVDIGVAGGIWGLKTGYCIMVGGDRENYERITPLLESLSPDEGYMHCGPAGAGHFVKMVHNGIEYALMVAYAEGYDILKASPYNRFLDLHALSHLWNQGSVIRSWLLELLETAFSKDPDLEKIRGYVDDTGEGRWTIHQAVESGVSATSIAHALFKRFSSRQKDLFSDKILAALRRESGGHDVKGNDET
jgi:6-phosphogluconate dehydrogenase